MKKAYTEAAETVLERPQKKKWHHQSYSSTLACSYTHVYVFHVISLVNKSIPLYPKDTNFNIEESLSRLESENVYDIDVIPVGHTCKEE